MYVYYACLIACSCYLYCIFRLLLPIELEKARLKFLLSCANRHVIVSRRSQLTFLAEFEYPLERHDVQCLMAAVGEKVVLRRDGQSEELFVSSLSERGPLLKYPVNTDFTSTHNAAVRLGPDDNSFLAQPGRLRVSARFYLARLTFKVLLTSVIDGVTGCGQEWFGRGPVLMCGLPLVSSFCTWHLHAYFAVYFVAASHFFASFQKYTYFTYYRFRMSELTRWGSEWDYWIRTSPTGSWRSLSWVCSTPSSGESYSASELPGPGRPTWWTSWSSSSLAITRRTAMAPPCRLDI